MYVLSSLHLSPGSRRLTLAMTQDLAEEDEEDVDFDANKTEEVDENDITLDDDEEIDDLKRDLQEGEAEVSGPRTKRARVE